MNKKFCQVIFFWGCLLPNSLYCFFLLYQNLKSSTTKMIMRSCFNWLPIRFTLKINRKWHNIILHFFFPIIFHSRVSITLQKYAKIKSFKKIGKKCCSNFSEKAGSISLYLMVKLFYKFDINAVKFELGHNWRIIWTFWWCWICDSNKNRHASVHKPVHYLLVKSSLANDYLFCIATLVEI